jgi:Spy/CpxP family protein refolding chaperone
MRRFLFLALLAPALMHAQDASPGGGAGRGQRMQQMLFQGITLNDTQQKQVDSIRAAYRPQIQSTTDRSQRRDMMQKEAADFRTVLTPDQQTQYDKNLADMRSAMRGGGSPQ